MRTILLVVSVAIAAAVGAWAADAKAGKAAYDTSCKSCHGPDGTPVPAVAKMMKVEMKDLKSKEIQSMTEADIAKVITGGKGKMMPIKGLNAKTADDVAAYVKTLK
jgi:mono/diheme cytochrome c family protein